jgi:hypothetical protein
MLSDRHVESGGNYRMLQAHVGATKKELKNTSATTIERAIEEVLGEVPGGIYITNVKIYAVDGDYLAVSGDVWGKAGVVTGSNSVQVSDSTKTAVNNVTARNSHNTKVAASANTSTESATTMGSK